MTVDYTLVGRTAEIRIEGHGEYNLFTPDDVYVPLAAAFERFRWDDEAWVALVYADQDKDVFTYGGHLKSVDRLMNADVDEDRGYHFPKPGDPPSANDLWNWTHLLEIDGAKIDKPMIFAVHGPCFGAGTLIVDSNADYVVASPTARFGLIEMRWGLGGSATQMIRSLPWRIAMDMALRGRQMEAAEALHYGWLNAVVPRDEVLAHAREIAEDYTHIPPLAARSLKRLALLNGEVPANKVKAIREAFLGRGVTPTPDQREGMRAFVEKRRPNYTGKPN